MDENKETQEVSKYLKPHIAPSQPEKLVNPILRNPDTSYLDRFFDARQVSTPLFTFSGNFSSVDIRAFVDDVVERQKRRLEQEGRGEIEIAGNSMGTALALKMRLEQGERHPAQMINSLTVTGNNGILDLFSLLPNDYKVVWVPEGNIEQSAHDLENKLFIICSDITSPEGVLVALHEIGHHIDLKDDPKRRAAVPKIQANMMAPKPEELKHLDPEFVKSYLEHFKPITDSDVKTFIESERNAWAFALRTMSRITNNRELIKACQEYIHEQPLRMQVDILRSRDFIK